MITLELLNDFIHEDLRYKSDIKVVYYKVNVNWIELKFNNVTASRGKEFMGEVVKLERYYNWLQSVREEKINKIL